MPFPIKRHRSEVRTNYTFDAVELGKVLVQHRVIRINQLCNRMVLFENMVEELKRFLSTKRV